MSSETVHQPRRKREVFNPLKRGGACSRCRRAKLRCDGVRPACSRCCNVGLLDCAYGDGPLPCPPKQKKSDTQIDNPNEIAIKSEVEIATKVQLQANDFGMAHGPIIDAASYHFSGNGNPSSHFHFESQMFSSAMGMTYDQTESSGPTTGRNSDSNSDSPIQALPLAKPEPQHNVEAGPSSTAMLTPNTEAILQQFLNLPTPIVEQTLDLSQSQMSDQTMSGALAKFTHHDQFGAPMQDIWPNNFSSEPPIPLYNAPPLLPTGLNLFGPSSVPYGGDPLDMQRFLSTLTGDAVAYHLSIPANIRNKGLEIGLSSEGMDSQPLPSSSAPEAKPPTGLPDFTSACLFGNEEDAPRKSNEPIDVPPFVKEKLLRVYLDSLRRCPAFYVNPGRLFRRLKGAAEDRPHPSWLFSMYLEGTRWVDDPALRNMETHFYSVAREHFDSGMSKTDRALDLTRTAINLALYLMRSDKEGESTMMAMHAVSMARACGCLVGRHRRGSQWTGPHIFRGGPLRQVRCSIDIPEDDEEVQERLDVAASVVAMETFGVMATGRPCAIDSFLTIPLQYFSHSADGSPPRFMTLQDLLNGEPVILSNEDRPSSAATRIAVALLGHVFRLTFCSRQEIGQQHRLAKIATDAFVAAFPPAWHDLANYVDDEPHLVVTERQVLLGLWCTIHMINAYICEAGTSLTNERPIDHARKIVQYLPIIQEKISTVPMQMTIYLEFCGRALKEEAGRLRSSGWHQPAQTLDGLSERTMTVMAKVARVYNLHDRMPKVSYEMHSQEKAADSPPFALNTQNSQSDSSSTAHM